MLKVVKITADQRILVPELSAFRQLPCPVGEVRDGQEVSLLEPGTK
jgi:hypothetical protein